jgi:hypothetical protein
VHRVRADSLRLFSSAAMRARDLAFSGRENEEGRRTSYMVTNQGFALSTRFHMAPFKYDTPCPERLANPIRSPSGKWHIQYTVGVHGASAGAAQGLLAGSVG